MIFGKIVKLKCKANFERWNLFRFSVKVSKYKRNEIEKPKKAFSKWLIGIWKAWVAFNDLQIENWKKIACYNFRGRFSFNSLTKKLWNNVNSFQPTKPPLSSARQLNLECIKLCFLDFFTANLFLFQRFGQMYAPAHKVLYANNSLPIYVYNQYLQWSVKESYRQLSKK
jgi:hypothetical protein